MKSPVNIIKNSLLTLSKKDLQEFSDICSAVEDQISGDGGGLTSGFLIDKLICEFFTKKLKDYEEYHFGEADLKLSNQPMSFKKIKGANAIALSWSKNPEYKKDGKKSKERKFWEFPLLILNLKTQKWWKTKYKNSIDEKIDWNLEIPRGFYIIDNIKVSKWVKLSKNNKTNSLVKKEYVYKFLVLAKKEKLFIEIPEPKDSKKWDLLYGVREKRKNE